MKNTAITGHYQRNCRYLLTGFLLTFGYHLLFAQGKERAIIVKGSSAERGIVRVDAQLNGNPTRMTCFQSESDCALIREGHYIIETTPPGEGKYEDCHNVILYNKSITGGRSNKLGQYCLLTE